MGIKLDTVRYWVAQALRTLARRIEKIAEELRKEEEEA